MMRVLKYCSMIVLILAAGIIVNGFISDNEVMNLSYGIDPVIASGLFIAAEIVFNITLLALAYGCGQQVNWKNVWRFNFSSFRTVRISGAFSNSMLIINRVAWCIPFVYLFVAGVGKLPILISIAILLEICCTIAFGLIIKNPIGRSKLKLTL